MHLFRVILLCYILQALGKGDHDWHVHCFWGGGCQQQQKFQAAAVAGAKLSAQIGFVWDAWGRFVWAVSFLVILTELISVFWRNLYGIVEAWC